MHHPVSFSYASGFPNSELVPIQNLPQTLIFGGADVEIHCTTCHDPHDNSNGNFLVMNNTFSALCTSCHQMFDWSVSGHSTIQQGCETCHTPHFAVAQPLLIYTSSTYCTTCHGNETAPNPIPHGESLTVSQARAAVQTTAFSMVSKVDIKRQIEKRSAHHLRPGLTVGAAVRNEKSATRSLSGTSSCTDCHNPHAANKKKAVAPYVSGMIQGVSGVDRNGMDIVSVTYEYEICLKCHGDYTTIFQYIPRVISTTNMRLAFDTSNPSYHPVVAMGKKLNIPSIPSSLEPTLSVSSVIYCSDCHHDDVGGSRGPHGSSYAPILGERYETADGTPESYENYALCYRCHNRTGILNDLSFKKKIHQTTATGGGHSGHLAVGTPCSACHDPHGINMTLPGAAQGTGSHTHLINFDARIVLPKPGNKVPIYTDTGTFSGSCTLLCHGKLHNNLSYP